VSNAALLQFGSWVSAASSGTRNRATGHTPVAERVADMSEEGLDVAACIVDVRRGDETAARALMQHLQPTVAKIVRANLPRRTSEEDMMQMVYIKVFTRLHQFSGTVPLHHWVSRVAVNECLAQIAKERVRPEVRWADLSEQHEEVLMAVLHSEEDLPPGSEMASREVIDKLLEGLSPRDRLVITLLHIEERTLQEVHEMTGWNIPVIKVRAFRARLKLKKRYEILIKQLQ
jgi:RNA polymerase sigma factor (sigma-70 family)